MPILSIIVPVYGVSQYLRQCLNSILDQSYQDFEVLVIDDGSKDDSGKIADDIAAQDPRVRVIHKENAGLPQARRTGVENALGTYVGFVDGDDFIEPFTYQMMMQKVVEENADIVCCAVYHDYDGKRPLRYHAFSAGDATFTPEQALCELWQGTGLEPYMCNKIIRKELFDSVEFSTGNPVGEDYFLSIQLLGQCKKIIQINTPGYHYMLRSGSMSRAGYNLERKKSLHLYNKWRSFLEERYESCKSQFIPYHLREEMAALVAMGRNQNIDTEEASSIGRDIRKNYKYLLPSKIGLRFIVAGGVAAINWKWLVRVSTWTTHLQQK